MCIGNGLLDMITHTEFVKRESEDSGGREGRRIPQKPRLDDYILSRRPLWTLCKVESLLGGKLRPLWDLG